MSNLTEHEAEQAAITALCEAGECDHPECRDEDRMVSRCAPEWAWNIIDETLEMDAQSSAFDADLRDDIALAIDAMGMACENPDREYLSRDEVAAEVEEPEAPCLKRFSVVLWEKMTYSTEVLARSEDEAQEKAEELKDQGLLDAEPQGVDAWIIDEVV